MNCLRCLLPLLAGLFVSCCWCQDDAQLAVNGSFEQQEDGRPAGWTVPESATATIMPEGAPGGGPWLKLEKGEGAPHTLVYQRHTVKPDTGYRLRAYIRAPRASYYSLVAYDAAMNTLSSKATGWAVIEDWVELVADFRTRETDRAMSIGLLGYGVETHWAHVRMWEDDTVRIGDLSPTVNELPTPTQDEQDRGFLLFTRPMEEYTSALHIPSRAECDQRPAGAAPEGEFETVMVMLHALRDLGKVRVVVPDAAEPRAEDWQHAELFQMSYTRRPITSQSYMRYPLLMLRPHAADLPAGEVLQYAVRVRVPKGRTADIRLPLRIVSEGNPPADAQVTVRALPFELDPADVSFFMYYADVYLPQEVSTPPYQAMYCRDMAEHGMNSVSLYVGPEKENGDGSYSLDLHHDYRHPPEDARHSLGMIERLAQMQAAGLSAPERPVVLLCGDGGKYDWGDFRSVDTIRGLVESAKRLGWPPLLFYVHDEPNTPERVELARKALEKKYALVPEARTVTAIGDYGIEHLGELYDVWITATADVTPDTLAKAAQMGKEVWAYDCRYKGCRPRIDRYLCGLYTWSTGVRGLGQWAYYSREKLVRNPDGSYQVPEDFKDWYMMPSDEGPIATIGWEARREGVEDFRYLRTLERLTEGREDEDARFVRDVLARARAMAPVDSFHGAPRDWRFRWEFDPSQEATGPAMHELRDDMTAAMLRLRQ